MKRMVFRSTHLAKIVFQHTLLNPTAQSALGSPMTQRWYLARVTAVLSSLGIREESKIRAVHGLRCHGVVCADSADEQCIKLQTYHIQQ